MLHYVEEAKVTVEDSAGPIGDAGSKEPSETIQAIPQSIPPTRLLQLLGGSW